MAPSDPTTSAATRCNCATFGSAAHCTVHTQADFDAQRRPIDDPAVRAIAEALTTPHAVNFDSIYVADRLRAEVMAMHVVECLERGHWEVRYVGPG